MEISAHVGAVEDRFLAALSDGRSIEATDLPSVAQALCCAGVSINGITHDWREGRRMLTAGQQVALSAAMRSLARKATNLPIAA